MIKLAGRRRRRRDKAMSSRSYESIPELELEPARADRSELPHAEDVEASIVERPSSSSQLEVKVDSPISKAKAQQGGEEEEDDRLSLRLELYKAALKGDWKAAEPALRSDKNAACLSILGRGDRLLHIAAAAKQTTFVRKLVKHLKKEELELTNGHEYTAFCYAAISGVVEIAKVMKERNSNLPTIQDELSPIRLAALMGKKKMAKYLYDNTRLQDFEAEERMKILVATIEGGIMLAIVAKLIFLLCADIALKILTEDRSIITSSNVTEPLHALARKPLPHYDFKRIYGSIQMWRKAVQLVKELCKQILTFKSEEIVNIFVETPILADAAKIGNVEFLTLLIQSYPDLIWIVDSTDNYSIFHIAVINRQEKVFDLIYEIGAIKDLLMLCEDQSGNNILHLAAKLAPVSRLNSVSGAALQMQRELLWFKEVEKIIPSSVLDKNGNQVKNGDKEKNEECKTPRELCTENHKKLREAGEDWMKDTATSCMVVATLIATIAFAAAFTVPGGNREETGAPIFLNKRWFTVFVISDAVAMFSSTTSIIMFLSILTSRYREDDFLFTLPAKLMVGLITLFASIFCMILTFSATFFLVYKEENEGTLPKIVVGLALLPIALYPMLNCRLWISLIWTRFMFRPVKHTLFY